jgi:flagellar basal-body rod protein FlgC
MMSVAAIALSGMNAATTSLAATASNVVNMDDVSAVGSASSYQLLGVVKASTPGGGVSGAATTLKPASLLSYDPISPVANVQGYVSVPEIDPVDEISAQMQASQAYAFSVKTLQVADETQQSLLNIQS